MAPPEVVRKVWGALLRVVGLSYNPPDAPPMRETTTLQRALSHTLAFDGTDSRAVRCTTAGALKVESQNPASGAPAGVTIADPTTPAYRAAVTASGLLQVYVKSVPSGMEYPARPVYMAEAPDSASELTLGSGEYSHDFGTVFARGLHISYDGSGAVRVYDSADGTTHSEPIGIIPGNYAHLYTRSQWRYLVFAGGSEGAHIHLRSWIV